MANIKIIPLLFTGNKEVLPNERVQKIRVEHVSDVWKLHHLSKKGNLIGATFGALLGKSDDYSDEKDLEGQVGTKVFVKGYKLYTISLNGEKRRFYELELQGVSRFRVTEVLVTEPAHFVKYVELDAALEAQEVVKEIEDKIVSSKKMGGDDEKHTAVTQELARQIRDRVVKLWKANGGKPNLLVESVEKRVLPDEKLPDFTIVFLPTSTKEDKMKMLNTVGLKNRLIFALKLINDCEKKLEKTPMIKMSNSQPANHLLGSPLGSNKESQALEKKLNELDLPEDTRKTVFKDLERFKKMNSHMSEYAILFDYLELICQLPWNTSSEDTISLENAEKILNEDHFSMEKVKKRILEYLAVKKLENTILDKTQKKKLKNPILCFVGPPGVGKTSVAQSIANSLGRKFHRIALGGTHDQAVIRGHRRTYVGSMPGRIIEALRVTGVNNPVILLDEIDKLGQKGTQGCPASALLEVLDPEQNNSFVDQYLNVPFDLSNCIFICTANESTMARPLKDRMEVIQMDSYTLQEKLQITKKFLLPKQQGANGLVLLKEQNNVTIDISDEFLLKMIDAYTFEAGVRSCERSVAALCRHLVLKITKERKDEKDYVIRMHTDEDLREVFGPYDFERKYPITKPGIAAGMAAMAYGGDVLLVECVCTGNKRGGKGSIKLTGSIGEVLQESAAIAMSYLRANREKLNLPDGFEYFNYHIHFPEGAIKKEGPSAGVTIATALYSLLSNKIVSSDVAMTGELSLRGTVLPVGGIKNKVIAAHNFGYKKIILPRRNQVNAENDLPSEVKEALEIHYVDSVEEVFKIAIDDHKNGVLIPSKL